MKKANTTIKRLCFKKLLTPQYVDTLESDKDLQITDAAIIGLHLRYYARTGRKVYYMWYRMRGSRIQRHIWLGTADIFSIFDIRAKVVDYKRDIAEGIDPHEAMRDRMKKAQEQEVRRKRVKDVFPEFMEKHVKENNKKNTYKSNAGYFKNHIGPILGEKYIADVDLSMVQDMYNKIKNAGTASMGDHVMRLVSSFLTWCEKYNYRAINTNPCGRVQKAKIAKFKPTLLTLDGYGRLLNALDEALDNGQFSPQTILAIKMLMLTGCRCSEITDLEHDEIDWEHGYLRLKKRKTDFFDVPLGDPAIKVLTQALGVCKSKQYVFHSPKDRKRPLVDLRKPFTWALERAGLPHMRIHDLRHSFASMGITTGEDIRVMKDVLGHTKITTTEMYTHTTNSAARRTANNVASAIAAAQV